MYFLNEVDSADIERFTSDDSNLNTAEDVNAEATDSTEPTDENAETVSSTSENSNFYLYLGIGVIALGGLIFCIPLK